MTYVWQVRSQGREASGQTTGTSADVDVDGWSFPIWGADVTVTVTARTTVSGVQLGSAPGSRTASVGRWGSAPSAPGPVQLVADGTRLTATWSAPAADGGSEYRYVVTWKVQGRRDEVRELGADRLQDAFDVPGDAPPGSDVVVTVQARNGSGTSAASTASWKVPPPPGPTPDPPEGGGG